MAGHGLPRDYRPDIDGLRAIAVLAVLVYHAFPSVLPGGFVGVDIFFVISGYLISRHILEELATGSFSIKTFYARRVRRIFPALILVMLACLLFGWLILTPGEYERVGRHVFAGALFLANVLSWREAGYFDTAADTKPLLHLWSLGIEEQFYIVWPLLLAVLWRWRRGLGGGHRGADRSFPPLEPLHRAARSGGGFLLAADAFLGTGAGSLDRLVGYKSFTGAGEGHSNAVVLAGAIAPRAGLGAD